MTTGIESFADMLVIGALHPGMSSGPAPGTGGVEWIPTLVVFVALIWWHLWQYRLEGNEIREAVARFKEVGVERTMKFATGKIASEEDMRQ